VIRNARIICARERKLDDTLRDAEVFNNSCRERVIVDKGRTGPEEITEKHWGRGRSEERRLEGPKVRSTIGPLKVLGETRTFKRKRPIVQGRAQEKSNGREMGGGCQ